MSINLTEKQALPFLSRGFRPFFMLACIAAITLLSFWLIRYKNNSGLTQDYYPYMTWHAHEMLFGYTIAVIAGFLLTAVQNWTQQKTAHGLALLMLALLWLLGRVAPFLPLPTLIIAIIDISFLPVLSLTLLKPLLLSGHHKNLIMIAILTLLTLCNIAVHGDILNWWATATSSLGIAVGLDTIILLIIIIATRVLPFFTKAVIPEANSTPAPIINKLAISSGLMLIIADTHLLADPLLAALLFFFATIHLIRLFQWAHPKLRHHPMLWSLYSGLAWIVISFTLKGLSLLGMVWPFVATHAFTVGVIGITTIAMLTRVSLGHTGRTMQSSLRLNIAFVLINTAAVVRVILPLCWPQTYPTWVVLSGLLWLLSFGFILSQFVPIWLEKEHG